MTFNFQQGAARIAEEERRVRESKGEECDMTLKNNIEGIIIKWAYQTDEVSIKNYSLEIMLQTNFKNVRDVCNLTYVYLYHRY